MRTMITGTTLILYAADRMQEPRIAMAAHLEDVGGCGVFVLVVDLVVEALLVAVLRDPPVEILLVVALRASQVDQILTTFPTMRKCCVRQSDNSQARLAIFETLRTISLHSDLRLRPDLRGVTAPA